ncbi:hypothetical protein [Haloarcula brevis]|uniref:hypothetical protein n=1 Tax=Haloarcula brevis TaxID=3111453 RepID=UPI00300EA074
MGSVARRFWLTVVPALTGLSTTGLLVLLALFPDRLFTLGTAGYVATAAVAFVSIGIVVWQLAVDTDPKRSVERPGQ